MRPLTLKIAQHTGIGGRQQNEDRVAVAHHDGHSCLVVSDGAGGHGKGARAAELAVRRVLAGFQSRPPVDGPDLAELLLDAHDAVVAGQRELGPSNGAPDMHATVVVLVIDTATNLALWGHVGDSRLYRWRGARLSSVTRDDSALQSVLDTGLVDAASARRLTHRGVLLSALGSAGEVAPHVSEPLNVEPSDAFLLCTDGWWGALDAQLISPIQAQVATPDIWLEAMIRPALERADPRQDNYTAVACWIGEPLEEAHR